MRRGRGTIEVVGMPFLDMISCAFAAVVVLYLITPDSDGSPDQFLVNQIVEIRVANGAALIPGVRFPAGSALLGCFEDQCEEEVNSVREWSRGTGRLTALLAENATPPDSIDVALLGGVGFLTKTCILVRIESIGAFRTVALKRADGFRRRVDPIDDASAPEETCP